MDRRWRRRWRMRAGDRRNIMASLALWAIQSKTVARLMKISIRIFNDRFLVMRRRDLRSTHHSPWDCNLFRVNEESPRIGINCRISDTHPGMTEKWKRRVMSGNPKRFLSSRAKTESCENKLIVSWITAAMPNINWPIVALYQSECNESGLVSTRRRDWTRQEAANLEKTARRLWSLGDCSKVLCSNRAFLSRAPYLIK